MGFELTARRDNNSGDATEGTVSELARRHGLDAGGRMVYQQQGQPSGMRLSHNKNLES